VHTFLAGLGLMPYFWWKNNKAGSEESKGGRLIFWSFIITIGLFTIGWMHIRLQHAGEQEDHDVRDRLIVGLESKRQQHLDEQGCKSREDWITWRKQVERAVEHPLDPISDTFITSGPANKSLTTAVHTHDLEAGDQIAKPSALKRALSRCPLFGAVNGERVNFGQWITTWRGRESSHSREWLNNLRAPSVSHAALKSIVPGEPRTYMSSPQSLGAVEKEERNTSSARDVTSACDIAAPMKNETKEISLAAICREVAQVAEQYAASAKQQARLTALLASHVSGERQGTSIGGEAQASRTEIASKRVGDAPSN